MTKELKTTTNTVKSKVRETGGERKLSVVSNKESVPKNIIPHPEVFIKGDMLYENQKDKNTGEVISRRVGRKLVISQTNRVLEDQTVSFDLEIYTKDGAILEEDVSRSILTNKEELFKTVIKGSDVNNANYVQYWKSLQNQDEMIKNSSMTHKELGWDIYNNQKIYKHDQVISLNSINSRYQGERDIGTKGTLEEYSQFIRDEIIGNTPLEAALVMGLGSVVTGYLDTVESHIFHIYGDSTTGKTTAGEAIVSLAGLPSLETNGLMMSFHSTPNSIVNRVKNLFGVPFLIDDSSVSNIQDFSTLIYQLAMGRDKDRLTKESKLMDASNWQTNIFTTGESSLLTDSNQNEGLKVRLSEFANVKWTNDSAHADRIKAKTQKYYGHGVKIVAEELLTQSDRNIDELLKYFEEHGKAYLKGNNKVNHLTDRKLKPYANIRLAIELFERRLNLGFDKFEIEKFLLHHMFNDERPMWKIAWEALESYIAKNLNRFNRQEVFKMGHKETFLDIEAKSFSGTIGKIEDKKVKTVRNKKTGEEQEIVEREISIIRDEFDQILRENKFNNPSSILKSWKKHDLIDAPEDRYSRKRQLTPGGSTVNVIVMKLEEPYAMSEDAKAEYHRRKKRDKSTKEMNRPKIADEKVQELKTKTIDFESVDSPEESTEVKAEGNLTEIIDSLEVPDLDV